MATYYVAEGGTATDQAKENATSGTYPGGCLSVAGHNAETFAAGDTINVKSDGGVVRAQLTTPSPGSSGNRITYSYDSDLVISGGSLYDSGWSVHSGNVWKVAESTHIYNLYYNGTRGEVQSSAANCTDTGHWYWASSVLYFYSSGGDPATVYTDPGVECAVRDNCIESTKSYITHEGNGAELWLTHFQTVRIHTPGEPTDPNTDVTIQDFICHDIMYEDDMVGIQGFSTHDTNNVIIKRIKVYNVGWNGIQVSVDDPPGGAVSNILVEECEVHHALHGGVDIHTQPGSRRGLSGITVRRCYLHDNQESGILVFNENANSTSAIYSVHIHDNVICNNGRCGIAFLPVVSDEPFHDCTVYNNSIYGNGTDGASNWGYGIYFEGYSSDIQNNALYNNCINCSTKYEILVSGTPVPTVDYNVAKNDSTSTIFYENGTAYNLANYQSVKSQMLNGKQEDPLFTDPGNGDLTLQSGSPCIGAGVNLGASYDDALMPSSTWPDGVVTGDQDDY